MKLDVLYEFQVKPPPWDKPHPYGQREAEQSTYFEAMDQIVLADKVGFQTVWVVEHHFREIRSHCPSSEVVLGALATSTKDIRLGFGVVLMPPGFQHPVRVAEKVATVDLLSRGRVEWGTGRSTPAEQTAFGVPTDDRSRQMWREAVEFVVTAWEQEHISWDTELLVFPERYITPRPYQDPHPPCWLAAASDASAANAGRMGLGLLSFALLQPVEAMARAVDVYRTARDEGVEPLTRVRNDRIGAYTLVHCCDDIDEAAEYGLWDSVRWWYKNLAEFTLKWEFPNLSQAEQDAMFPLLEPSIRGDVDVERYLEQDMIILGTPAECFEKMQRYDEAGIDQLLCYTQFGTLPHNKVMRCHELLGTEVIPRLEERGHRFDFDTMFA
ncbi:MAG: LLM class flavin-dependent oxidoreductase [Acidimicrobiales bacterium]|jgi:alkanesulfonate monooxygenase SsuD/methylene tetrahydromethanopterin reductase-like flavin-dependent oxidoreductase (luciferase family)|nr:LLM class flavin-dependent oxidoreductase [Acidimicrobiales bacterium]|tara:strand:- start:1127 stop:2275 length:1149 start_codon:yes stop_codon:yes gene_type:complete